MLSQQFQISIPTEKQNKGQNVVQIPVNGLNGVNGVNGVNVLESLKQYRYRYERVLVF